MNEDKYADFEHLAANEVADADFRIRIRTAGTTLVMAPHGGGMEPGTSELVDAIAGADHSAYIFEGIKATGNGDLHITSARFDEPTCVAILGRSDAVLTIHGERSNDAVVFVGGLDTVRLVRISAALTNAGFEVRHEDRPHLAGRSPENVCNRGRTGAGVQLEIAEGLRRTFFRQLTLRAGRQHRTTSFDKFVAAVRESLREPNAAEN